jgi:hypothetical protein
MDSFEQMHRFYRDFTHVQKQEWLPTHTMEVIAEAAQKAFKISNFLTATEAFRGLNVSKYELDMIARLKPSAAELQIFRINQSYTDAANQAIRYLVPPQSAVIAQFTQQEARWRESMTAILAHTGRMELLASSVQKAILTQEMAQLRVAESLKRFNVFDKCDALAARLMLPQHAFADFASMTAARLADVTSSVPASALRASLRLAEMQLVTTSDVLARALGCADVHAATTVVEHEPLLVVPSVQQQELLDSGLEFHEEDSDGIINSSSTAQTAELAGGILLLVTQCNEASKLAGKGYVFKPTNRMLEAFARLPWELATDKKQLADIVDCLFWTLYEGAGDDNLRFLKDKGGWMDVAECDAVFRVKRLRNKWLRHDPNHGNELKISKSWQDVLEALKELGLKGLPVNQTDYRRVHACILRQVEAFLKSLLARIVESGNQGT